MTGFWTAILSLCVLPLPVSLFTLFFSRFRPKAKWALAASVAGIVVSFVGVVVSLDPNEQAHVLGFEDQAERRAAEQAGVAHAKLWRSLSEEAKATKAEQSAATRRERAQAQLAKADKVAAHERILAEAQAMRRDEAAKAAQSAAAQQQRAQAELAKADKVAADRRLRAEAQAKRDALLIRPAVQTAFMRANTGARGEFARSQPELQQGAARPSRAAALCATMSSRYINGWLGKISELTTNGSGDGVEYSDKTIAAALQCSPPPSTRRYRQGRWGSVSERTRLLSGR